MTSHTIQPTLPKVISMLQMPVQEKQPVQEKPHKHKRNPDLYYSAENVSSRFGVRLRQLRRERNFTQLRMAVDFGIDRTFISDVERGRKTISLPMLEVIALGMKVSLSDLLSDL